MVKRLTERYQPHDAVEIYLRLRLGAQGAWTPGRVERHAFPGIWVRTEDGGRWYVTNSRRIRSLGARSD